MSKISHALIMAAGRGNRMMPLTAIIPKPMAPYLNSTLISEGIRRIRPYFQEIHITVGYKGAALAEHVIGQGVSSVFNTTGEGNAWWIYNTLMKYVDEPTLVLTCDNVVELDYEQLVSEYYRVEAPACMLVPVIPIPGLEGDYIFQERNIVTAIDRNKPSDRYCSGIQIINPYQINRLTRASEDFYQVWNQLIERQQVHSSAIYPKRWFAVDTLSHLETLNNGGECDQSKPIT